MPIVQDKPDSGTAIVHSYIVTPAHIYAAPSAVVEPRVTKRKAAMRPWPKFHAGRHEADRLASYLGHRPIKGKPAIRPAGLDPEFPEIIDLGEHGARKPAIKKRGAGKRRAR